jgi:hypothetical protein
VTTLRAAEVIRLAILRRRIAVATQIPTRFGLMELVKMTLEVIPG